jgi:hypothetical protein
MFGRISGGLLVEFEAAIFWGFGTYGLLENKRLPTIVIHS